MSPLRRECNAGRRHVEVRNCMIARSRTSTLEVEQTELALLELINKRAAAQPTLKRSAASYEAASKSYARYRHHQCEYAASLVNGQGLQREARLSCTYDINLKRKQQLAELRAALPEALPSGNTAAAPATARPPAPTPNAASANRR